MGNYTREEILQMVEDEDVEFIRLQFTDMFGVIKNIAVTARELPRALNNQCVIDGEQIAGTSGLKDADLYLRPVLDTFAILPWRPQQGKVARMICDLYFPDGTPYKNSPRYILENVAGKAQAEGYTCYIDPECEFFLFHTEDNGNPTTVTHEQAGYLDISPLDLGENAREIWCLHWKIWEWKLNPLITRQHRLSMKLIFVMARSVRLRTALLLLRWLFVLWQRDMAFMRHLCRNQRQK